MSNILLKQTHTWKCDCGFQSESPTVKLATLKFKLHKKKCDKLTADGFIAHENVDLKDGLATTNINMDKYLSHFEALLNFSKK
jgi:hypothetical protein